MMTERDKIRAEAIKQVGGGRMSMEFELGAEYALGLYPQINKLAETAYYTAVERGKTHRDLSHLDTFFGILSELKEFREASEIDWQTGTPLKTGKYLVTVSYGKGIYGTQSDYFHIEDGWTYYNDGSVVAWCDLKYIEPYKPIEQ